MQRYFTPDEANEALAEVRPLAERMVEHRHAFAEAQRRRAELAARISGNGGGLDPRTLRETTAEVEREAAEVAACVRRIGELGVQVKDLDQGLVDFPARRRGEDVLLCWRVGEDEVAFWHGLEEGFAGRKPLPL